MPDTLVKNPLRPLLAAAVVLALAAGDASAQFSNAWFFGDSLTDSGTYKPLLPPGTGLFTTNPGPVWSQLFARRYGFDAVPANQGGTNFAQGGARVANLPGVPDAPPTGSATPISGQVAQLVASGPLDRNALYAVWGGANDIFSQLDAAASGAITPAQLQANIAQAANDLVGQVGILSAAGARYLVVFNLPDIGRTPAGIASGQRALISGVTNLFNGSLIAGLDALGVPTIRFNIYALVNEALADPSAFGLTNVTTPACGTTPALLCTPANLVVPDAASTFLFADGAHPTSAGHAIIAQAVESMIEGPMKVGVLAEAPLGVEQSTFRAIDARMISALGAPVASSRFSAWVSYDYGHNDFAGNFVSGNADVNTIAIGGDAKLTDHALVGAAFTYADDKGDFGGDSGGYKMRETAGTLYAGYGDGPWYAGATLGAGDLDYRDVHRQFALGPLSRTERGGTRGWHVMASVLGGYWFRYADLLHGPFVRLAYQDIHVNGYAESGSDSTALVYGDQKRESFVSTLGWQVAGQIGAVRPFARIAYELESKDDTRFVSASSVTLGGQYAIPTIKPDRDYVSYLLGASSDFGRVTGYLTGFATSGRTDGNAYGVTVGVRVPL
ncbi:MAG TPA: autotransporter domain-containing protein [Casimicrobiaceae bacterium]|nr:autotransporter domain-containing protein [Casimicrobiaceae bacterium]